MSIVISRRQFLQLAGIAAASGIIVPAFILPRDPYVKISEVVDYIGPHPGGFIGGKITKSIKDWDGVGYPVECVDGWGTETYTFYDFNLVNFRREVPDDFWHHEINNQKYNNIHTYVREKRFGETIAEAVKALNFASSNLT